LAAAASDVIVVDLNEAGVKQAAEFGFQGHIGDATQYEVLEHAHVRDAKVVVITVPHHRTSMMIVEAVRGLAPNAHIVVRSRYQRDINDLVVSGADMILGDEEEIGRQLGQHLREWLAMYDKGAEA
jgi:CPA2 family monovalent cation:H+ antiporter-2